MSASQVRPARNDAAPRSTAGDVLIEWSRRTPCRIALADTESDAAPPRSWTCEALRDDAAMLAVALLSRYAQGERIAIWAPACPEGVLLQFAAAFAGLTLVAIDPACQAADLKAVLDHSGAVGLFNGGGERARAAANRAGAGLREVVDLSDRWALFAKRRCIDGLPDVDALDPAQIGYAVDENGSLRRETVLQGDLADALRSAIAGGARRSDALLPCFPRARPAHRDAAAADSAAPAARVVAVA